MKKKHYIPLILVILTIVFFIGYRIIKLTKLPLSETPSSNPSYVETSSDGQDVNDEPIIIKFKDVPLANHQIKLALYSFDSNKVEKIMFAVNKEQYEKDKPASLNQMFKGSIIINKVNVDHESQCMTVDIDGSRMGCSFNAGSTAGGDLTNTFVTTLLNLPDIDKVIITVDGEKDNYSDHYSFIGTFVQDGELTYYMSYGEAKVTAIYDVALLSNQIKLAVYNVDCCNEISKTMFAIEKARYEKDKVAVINEILEETGIEINQVIVDPTKKLIRVDISDYVASTFNEANTFFVGNLRRNESTDTLVLTLLNLPDIDEAVITVDGEKDCHDANYSFEGVFIQDGEIKYKRLAH